MILYDKGAEMVRRDYHAEKDAHGRWEILARSPGKVAWLVDGLRLSGWDGPTILLDAGPHLVPARVPLSFAAMQAVVVTEVEGIEEGRGMPVRARRGKTIGVMREMARGPIWTSSWKAKDRETLRERRRYAYVLAVADSVVPRPSSFLMSAA